MSKWRHSICNGCWTSRNPDREPVRIREEFRDEQPETCCFCGRPHGSGIYLRADPISPELKCGGVHREAA
jgi:hypothetical protein